MFKPYQSKPIERMAFQITNDMTIGKSNGEWYVWGNYEDGKPFKIMFKAHQTPVHLDYICRLTLDDTYHVEKKVFEERNIVE